MKKTLVMLAIIAIALVGMAGAQWYGPQVEGPFPVMQSNFNGYGGYDGGASYYSYYYPYSGDFSYYAYYNGGYYPGGGYGQYENGGGYLYYPISPRRPYLLR